MKRFLKSFRYGQRGFTLIELLVVIAILGVLALVVVPNITRMLGVADVAAANTEAAAVETAAVALIAENNGVAPTPFTSDNLLSEGPPYLTRQLKATYVLNTGGMIDSAALIEGGWTGIVWHDDDGDPPHQWVRIPS